MWENNLPLTLVETGLTDVTKFGVAMAPLAPLAPLALLGTIALFAIECFLRMSRFQRKLLIETPLSYILILDTQT